MHPVEPAPTMEDGRTGGYRRNEELESLLAEINGLLAPVEARIAASYERPRRPVVLIVGGPRSGSTLFLQWLASTGEFAYPSNLLARFYRAPALGAKIQQLLTDPRYAFRDELPEISRTSAFVSDLGKTRGVLEPNDFWYFWRRFIPNVEPVQLDDEALARIDTHGFLSELAALEAVFDLPFAMKAMILEQNIPFLAEMFGRVLIVNLRRDPFFNIQSLLEARERFFGTRERWYSIKPRQFEELRGLDPIAQVVGQVHFKNLAVEQGLSAIEEDQRLDVAYEDFCRAPQTVFERLRDKLRALDHPFQGPYRGPSRFRCANTVRLSEEDCARVVEEYERRSGHRIEPVP